MLIWLSTKEIVKRATLGIPKEIKNAIFISIAFSVDILIRNMDSEEHKTKNRLT